jgi:ribonuclease HII
MKKFDLKLLPENPDFEFERVLWQEGVDFVAGIDEAGRGALAGPVAAAALIFPSDASLASRLDGVRDSKQMTPTQRDCWRQKLCELALTSAVGFASAAEIDMAGIVAATSMAVHRAIAQLKITPQYLLLDYMNLIDCKTPSLALVKGDARSLSIAAASILAKTARDTFMRQMDLEYPDYGFAAHKGYGTAAHCMALEQLGASPIHRKTFKLKRVWHSPDRAPVCS